MYVKKICYLLLFINASLYTSTLKDAFVIQNNYQATIEYFLHIEQQNKAQQNFLLPKFFIHLKQPYNVIKQSILKDINTIKKILKKEKKALSNVQHQTLKNFLVYLDQIYKTLKKYRLQYNAVLFHKQMQEKYKALINVINTSEDIAEHMDLLEISELGLAGLKILKKTIEQDLQKIEYYQDRLHTDWIDEKLLNYVLKIDLIRLRNDIIFHPFFKGTHLKLFSEYPR